MCIYIYNELHQLAALQQTRTKAYTKLVRDIHHMFIRVTQEERKLREQRKKSLSTAFTTNAKPTTTAPTAFKYADNNDETTININLQPLPSTHPQLKHDDTAYSQVWAFLTTMQGQIAGEDNPGISWIELAALFVARGGNHNAQQPYITPTIANFKRTVKMVIADLGDDTANAAFTPAKNAWPRLKPLGITNHQPATNFLPQVTQEEGREVARYILGHKTSMNQKATAAHSEGTLQVKIAKHKFKGLAEWDKQFTIRKCVKETLDSLEVQREKKIQGDLTGAVDFKSTVVAAVATQPERDGQEFRVLPKSRDSMIPGTTGSTIHQNMVRCTNCGNSKKVRPSQLCTSKGWGRLSCKWQGCHHKAKAHKWPCTCGKMRTECQHHYNHLTSGGGNAATNTDTKTNHHHHQHTTATKAPTTTVGNNVGQPQAMHQPLRRQH